MKQIEYQHLNTEDTNVIDYPQLFISTAPSHVHFIDNDFGLKRRIQIIFDEWEDIEIKGVVK